jgi:disulfide bond formation protein DsbB
MDIPPRKTIGWTVVFLGLLAIGFSIYFSWLFFTAKADFPPVFKSEEKTATFETNLPAPSGTPDPAAIQALTQQAMSQAVADAMPKDTISKLLNMASWSMFAFFLVMAGSYLAGVGIKLLTAKEA